MFTKRAVPFVACVVVFLWLAPALAQAPASRTVWDGVYTAAQADRGDKIFETRCASCHGADMRGGPGVPGLVGTDLLFVWNDKAAWPLFDLMKGTMPQDNPGGLRDQEYADILAALFRATKFPAGDAAELAPAREALERVMITKSR